MGRKIRVLVLDDSVVFREILSRGLSMDEDIQVVATAENPYDAIDKIESFNPDVITCDVEMPRMNGIEFIRQLLPQHPIPIIVVSALSNAVFDAMNSGAVDFITKPNISTVKGIEYFIDDMIRKIKEVSNAKVKRTSTGYQKIAEGDYRKKKNLIAIGASTGGTESIYQVLKGLPNRVPGIVIVQHIPPLFSRMFAERLNQQTGFDVQEGKTGLYVEPGKVIVAPGDKHMIVKKHGEMFRIEVFEGEKVNGHCPSVDVLFDSIAQACGESSVGVILTGMGYDGARGLLNMRRKGARTIGQDELSSIVYGMPKVAYEVGAVERQYSLDLIPQAICNTLR